MNLKSSAVSVIDLGRYLDKFVYRTALVTVFLKADHQLAERILLGKLVKVAFSRFGRGVNEQVGDKGNSHSRASHIV